MKIIITILCIAVHLYAAAQEASRGKVTVTIINSQQAAAENATVELVRANDSSLVKASLSDKEGKVEFENIIWGAYLIKATLVNFSPQYSTLFTLSAEQTQAPSIVLQPAATSLATVTVTNRKPFLQKLSDRIVVNVENSSVSAGSSAMDVLERSPGVNIDQNDNLSLRGKAGVIIMIDGKPTPMTGSDLANYLKGLPSAAIERIDIITNPSARYDAAGNSGIIDIRMKKDQRLGTNGTLTTGYGQGVYPKANAGTTFNYRNRKINIFGNYNYAYRVGLNHLLLDRSFYETGVYNGGDLKDNYSKSPSSTHTSRMGMDFFASPKQLSGSWSMAILIITPVIIITVPLC